MEPVGASCDQANARVEGFDASVGEAVIEGIEDCFEMLVANGVTVEPSQQAVQGGATGTAAACPECKENTLIFENGCFKCTNCGYSKCE